MSLKEFVVNGKKILLNDDFSEEKTGIVSLDYYEKNDLDKTQEIQILNNEKPFEKESTNLFEEDKNE